MNLLSYVERARAEFPAVLLSADEVATCLYRAAQYAQADGFDVGVLLKPNGAGGMSPIGRISMDILIDIADEQEYDAFASADGENGAPGPARPVWDKLPFHVGKCAIVDGVEKCSGASMDRVRRPSVVDAPPVPPTPDPKPPAPAPAPVPVDRILDHLNALHQKLEIQGGLLEDALQALARLENDNRKSRTVTVSGGWLGTLRGSVSGVKD